MERERMTVKIKFLGLFINLFLMIIILNHVFTIQANFIDHSSDNEMNEQLDINDFNSINSELFNEIPKSDWKQIEIDGDSNFADFNFPGSGTESDPYIIEGFDNLSDVHISSTTVHFIFRNNIIVGESGGGFGLEYIGLTLYKVKQGKIFNNEIMNVGEAIEIGSISNSQITIQENNMHSNQAGIEVNRWSDYPENFEIIIKDNIIATGVGYSMYLFDAPNAVIQNNQLIADTTSIGIKLYNCPNSIVEGNNFQNTYLEIIGNDLSAYQHSIKGNTVNNQPLIYINDQNMYVVNGNGGQLIIINSENVFFDDLNYQENPIRILVAYSNYVLISGVLFPFEEIKLIASNNVEITNSTFQHGWLLVNYNTNLTIIDNTITEQRYHGISLTNNQQIKIQNNQIKNNYKNGISSELDKDLQILENNITHNNNGIYIKGSQGSIQNNFIGYNLEVGIQFLQCNKYDFTNCTSGTNIEMINNTFVKNGGGNISTTTTQTYMFGFKGTFASLLGIILLVKINRKRKHPF
jgi:parallel beta-helix repeat protein